MSLEFELNNGGDDESKRISQLVRPARKRGANVFDVFRENKLALVGVVVIAAIVLFCFLGPLLYHTNQISTNLSVANDPPGAGHPLGTDNVGYDELGRLMVGGQSSLEIRYRCRLPRRLLRCLLGRYRRLLRWIRGNNHDAHC